MPITKEIMIIFLPTSLYWNQFK